MKFLFAVEMSEMNYKKMQDFIEREKMATGEATVPPSVVLQYLSAILKEERGDVSFIGNPD